MADEIAELRKKLADYNIVSSLDNMYTSKDGGPSPSPPPPPPLLAFPLFPLLLPLLFFPFPSSPYSCPLPPPADGQGEHQH